MYEVEFSQVAEKQFYKLEWNVQTRIANTLERRRVRPHAYAKKLVGSPYFRLQAGNYRIIIDIKEGKLIIFVIWAQKRHLQKQLKQEAIAKGLWNMPKSWWKPRIETAA